VQDGHDIPLVSRRGGSLSGCRRFPDSPYPTPIYSRKQHSRSYARRVASNYAHHSRPLNTQAAPEKIRHIQGVAASLAARILFGLEMLPESVAKRNARLATFSVDWGGMTSKAISSAPYPTMTVCGAR
jgi:hypothetical protein